MKYHFIKDMVLKGAVKFQYISCDERIADVLTNPLSVMKYGYFRDKLSIEENFSLTKREC